jgi:RHS repeat-associated protein
VAAVNDYRPFGSPLAGEGGSPYGFTGEWWEGDAGLLFLRARYYQPGTGRFLSQDAWRGNVWRPATLHRYVYVLNNSVNGIDPSGLRCLFFDQNCDEVAEKAWDWVTDRAQDVVTLPWRVIPGDFCLGSLGCWGGEEYADWLEEENFPSIPGDMYWVRYHPAQAWGLPEDSLKTLMIEDWFFELGEEVRYFGEHHPATQILMHHRGVNDARDKFYYENGCEYTTYGYDAKQGKEGIAVVVVAAGAHLRVAVETLLLWGDNTETIEGTLGSYSVKISNNGDGSATFVVENTTSWQSGTFGLIRNKHRDETGPNWLSEYGVGGNLRQVAVWNEPIIPGLCDCQQFPSED